MKKIYLFLFFITPILIYIHSVQAQEISDSVLLERSLHDKNEGLADSILNSWYSQSVNNHGRLENDTVKFVYKVYSRFMKDYLHKKMTGKKGIPVNRSELLSDVLEFPDEMNRAKFLINFKNPFQPEVLYILVDSKMRYAFVEYLTGTGNVNMAFYPLKLINSDDDRKGIPISWHFIYY